MRWPCSSLCKLELGLLPSIPLRTLAFSCWWGWLWALTWGSVAQKPRAYVSLLKALLS